MTSRRVLVAAPLIIVALALNACGSGTEHKPGRNSADKLAVVTSFYPLPFAAAQIGGGHVAVTSPTKPRAEPHNIELTPREVATINKASLVVYELGLQSAVDKAVESQGGDRGLDVAPAANLNLRLALGRH